jgi:hypothetical protein
MRYLSLAILASTALSQSAPRSANSNEVAQSRDFDWDIEPEDGYPASPLTQRGRVRSSSSTTSQERSAIEVLGRHALPERLRLGPRRIPRLHQ